LPGFGVARLDVEGLLEAFAGAVDHALGEIDASKIEMRVVAGFVARSFDRALQPDDRFVVFLERNQICADVVVGIAEIGIDFDSALALFDCVLHFSLKVIRPAQKGVRFRGRMNFQGVLV
jgi:hypothetical protein